MGTNVLKKVLTLTRTYVLILFNPTFVMLYIIFFNQVERMIKLVRLSNGLKKSFCKDNGINIGVYEERCFEDRIKLYDNFYNSSYKLNQFKKGLEKYNTEQDYFNECNRVESEIIKAITENQYYKEFEKLEQKFFVIKNKDLSTGNIYKEENVGKSYISIDMKEANFSALRNYNEKIFDCEQNWKDFVRKFTDDENIINSKHFRQVVFGKCNTKRIASYEKKIMDNVLICLFVLMEDIYPASIASFNNDEIVFDVTLCNYCFSDLLFSNLNSIAKEMQIPFKVEYFVLRKVDGSNSYMKEIRTHDGIEYEFKHMDKVDTPFIFRKIMEQEVKEEDKVFYYEGRLAKLLEEPEIKIEKGYGKSFRIDLDDVDILSIDCPEEKLDVFIFKTISLIRDGVIKNEKECILNYIDKNKNIIINSIK